MRLKYGVQQAPQTSIVYWCHKKELFGYYQIQILDILITHSHHLNQLFFKEQLLKVQDIFKMRIANFICNCLNKTSPVNVQLWLLTIQVHNHNTRSEYINIDKSIYTNNLFIPTGRTSHYIWS